GARALRGKTRNRGRRSGKRGAESARWERKRFEEGAGVERKNISFEGRPSDPRRPIEGRESRTHLQVRPRKRPLDACPRKTGRPRRDPASLEEKRFPRDPARRRIPLSALLGRRLVGKDRGGLRLQEIREAHSRFD